MPTVISNMLFTAIIMLSIVIAQSAPTINQSENGTLNDLELKYDCKLCLTALDHNYSI